MNTPRVVKNFLARLAGAPLPVVPVRRAQASGLYCQEPPPRQPTSRQRDGSEGEGFARRHLERAGLTFVAANVRYRDGELDLVMRDIGRGGAEVAFVFVEVRRRARGTYGGAAGSITPEKRRRVVAAASHFLVGLGLRTLPPCRFDVVTIEGDLAQGFRIEWLRDAFRDEG
jgi:putative endonuclease